MGGGDNELVIKSILDNTGFAKGSKQLMSAIKGLSNSMKSMFGRIAGAASVFGIISKAVSTFMSQNQALTKQMNAAWTALGNALGPIITQIVNWVTKAVSYLVTLMKLLGFTSKTASQASKAAQGAAGGLQRTLAGFDELNKLSSGGGGGAGTLQDVDPTVWMEKFVEAIKGKMWDVVANLIIEKFNGIIEKVKSKAEELGSKIGEYLGGIAHIVARVIKEVNWSGIGEAIASFLNGIMDNVDGEDLGTILVGKIVIAFNVLMGFLETLNWGRLAEMLADILIGALNSLADAVNKADWELIGTKIVEFFGKLWEKKDEIAEAILNLLKAVWNAAVDLFCGAIGVDETNRNKVAEALEGIIGGAIAIKGASKFAAALGGVSKAAGAVGGAAEGAAAGVGAMSLGIGTVLGALSGGGLAALSMVPVAMLDTKLAADYANDAMEKSGGTIEGLAEQYEILTEKASHYDEALYDTTGTATVSAQEARYAQEALEEVTNQLADSLGITSEELKAQIEAADGDITKIQALADAGIELVSSNSEVSSSTDELTGALGRNAEQLAETEEDTVSFGEKIKTSVSDAYENMKESVSAKAAEMKEKTSEKFSEIKEKASTAFTEMKERAIDSFSNMKDAVTSRFEEMRSGIYDTISNLVSYARDWGADLIQNLWNGINSQLSGFFNGIRNIAQGIRNFLGFSEPKEGPLSDFHTYGPDMMDLYAKGIQSESAKVYSAVNDVAEGVADGLEQSPMALSAVASGSVVPYGVTGGVETSVAPNDGVSLTEVRDILTEIRNLLGTMEFVAQFGDLRAVAQRITTIQKQMERARG